MRLKIVSISDLRWIDADQSGIDMMIELDGAGTIPFTARPDDIEPHGRKLFADAVSGDFGSILPIADEHQA